MRRTLLLPVVLIALAFGSAPPALAQTTAGRSCTVAQAALDDGRLGAAARRFRALARRDGRSRRARQARACGRRGLRAARRAQGRRQAEVRRQRTRRRAEARRRRAQREQRAATAGRARERRGEARAKLAAALALEDAGFHDQAQAQAAGALTQDPGLAVPDRLRPESRRPKPWDTAVSAALPWIRAGLEALAALALLLFALLTVRRLRRRTLRVVPFEGQGAVGGELPAAIGEELARLEQEAGILQPLRVTAEEAAFDAPDTLTAALPPVGLAAALLGLLDRLVPGRGRVLTGLTRSADPVRGMGLRLTLADRRGRVTDEVTVWEADVGLRPEERDGTVGDDDRRLALALPAAIWLAFRPELGFRPARGPFGATSWQSFALLAAGQRRRGEERQRALFERAVTVDPGNGGAVFNLAAIDLRRPNGRARAERAREAVRRLEQVAAEAERRGGHERVPLWYRTRYLEATARLILADAGDGPTEHAARAVVALLRVLRTSWDAPDDPVLRTFVGEIVRRAKPALASALLLRDGPAGRTDAWRNDLVAAVGRPSDPGAAYNLACYFSRLGASLSARDARNHAFRRALDELGVAVTGGGEAVTGQARRDEALAGVRTDPDWRYRFAEVMGDPPPAPP